jgi:chalcone isomerase
MFGSDAQHQQVAFSEDSSVPEAGGVAIANRPLCEAVLESIIGEHGVSPAAKLSIAARVSELLKGAETGPAGDAQQAEPVPVSA